MSRSIPSPVNTHATNWLKIILLTILILVLIVPAVMFSMAAFRIMPLLPSREESQQIRSAISVARGTSPGGIVSNAMPGERYNAMINLRDLAAERYEAKGHVKKIFFVGVQSASSPSMESPATRKPADKTLELSLAADSAVVVIATEPVRWTVSNHGARHRARVGFEGAAPMQFAGIDEGQLTGFRIGAFGARQFAVPVDPVAASPQLRQQLCAAVNLWSQHFGVDWANVGYTLVPDASVIRVGEISINSNGAPVTYQGGPTLRQLCYGSPRRSSYNPNAFPVNQPLRNNR